MSDLKALQKQFAEISGAMAKLVGDQPTILFRDFALEYLRAKLLNPTLRTSTKRSFENQVEKHLIPAFGNLPLERIKNGEWLQWVTDMRDQNKIGKFFNARKALIEILNAAVNEGHLSKLTKLDNPDEKTSVGRVLEPGEIIRILRKLQRPFRFIFYVFWKMGCRPREILQWAWSMFRWGEPSKSWINIPARISKTDRSRSIPINPEVSAILLIRFQRGNGSEFVFPSTRSLAKPQMSYQSAWDVACKKAGVENAMPYDLRRTFITRCMAEGKSPVFVAKALDTSTKMIEDVYTKTQEDVMEGIIK